MNHRLRKAVILFTAAICFIYLIYRGIYTLNLSTPYAVFASLLLYFAEIYGVVVVLLFFLQVWDTREPPEQPILPNRFVDVFVPTYNEDPDLLRATLQACVRMDYPHRTFLCDDGGTDARVNDPEKGPSSRERAAKIKVICNELGVTYVTRPDNRHAKAGNLNYAFEQTDGEFIIIFDADHVPEPHFISRLIGYFADEKLAFVQTPHAFYNFESFQSCYDHQKSQYWEDGQLFYKVIQPGRNCWNAAIFAGSAAMFRRKALEEVGYIATETITEDMHTGLRMHSKGWRSLGVSQRLICGQAAPDVTTFHTQRLRWGEGNLSIMAHDNPLFTRGLKLGQRLCYFGSMIHWAGGVFKLAIYFTPLLMLLSGVPPVNQFTWTLFAIMAMYVSASIYGVRFISNGHGSFWRNEMFTMLGFWTQIQGTMRALFMRKLSKFVVTSKRGRQSKSVWPFIRPHVYFVALSVLALFWGWGRVIFGISADFYKPILASCWTVFHMSLAIACIRRSLWPEDLRYAYRHTVHLPIEFESLGDPDEFRELGSTIDISEGGAAAVLFRQIPVGAKLRVRILGAQEELDVAATVVWTKKLSQDREEIADENAGYRIGMKFESLQPDQFDVLNRIIMHYAVPRLYEQYYAQRPGWISRAWSAIRRGPIRRRASPRELYRLPFKFSTKGVPNGYAVTEDVSREAVIALLADPLPKGAACEFRIQTPAGALDGLAEVVRHETRTYAARPYYLTVFNFTHFEDQGRVKFEDLLNPLEKRAHGEALIPVKKALPVPMGKNAMYTAAALLPFLLVLALTFRILHRDDMYLRDLVASNEPVSAEQYEKLERIYAATLQETHPSTDRLVLLVSALSKAGRDSDTDQVMTILASRDRKNLDLQIARANAYLNSRDYSRARAEYERLFREFQEGNLPPERKRTMLMALARSTFHEGNVAEAARLFRDLIQSNPSDFALRYEVAGAMVSAQRYDEAAQAYAGVTPDRHARLLLATAALLAKKPADAERQCDMVLRDSPNDVEAQMLKADILNARNNKAQAEVIYNRLRRINPGDPAIRSRLAFIALSGKNFDQALALFQQLYEDGAASGEDVKGLVDAAASASAVGPSHREIALRLAEHAAMEWKDDAVYLGRLAWVLQWVKELDKSVDLLEMAMQKDANSAELTHQYVGALFEAGQRDKALPLLEAGEKTADNRALLATIYLDKKRYLEAEAECRAVLLEKPNDPGALKLLSGCLSGQGNHKEALALLRKLAADRPNDPQIPVWIAQALLASGDHAGALERFRTMLEAFFEQPELWEHLINAAAGVKTLPPEILPMIRQIADRAGQGQLPKADVVARLAWILITNGEKELTPKLLDQTIVLKPKDPSQRIEIAGVLALAGRNREALAMYQGIPLDMQDPDRLLNLYCSLQDWAPAEKLCWSMLQKNPDDRSVWRWLADVLSWKGEYDRSLEWFGKLHKDKPDDDDIKTRIAEVTLWNGNPSAALLMFFALLEKSFEQPRLWADYLAAAAGSKTLDAEQIRNIVRIHERSTQADRVAIKLRSDPLFLARMALALDRAGMRVDAEPLFARALELAPQDRGERKEFATILSAAKMYKEALGLYEGLTLDLEERFRLISICSAAQDFAQAKQRCEAILEEDPKNKRAKRLLADVLSWNREYPLSLRCFNELLRDDPENLDLKIRAAEVTLWSKDHAQALAMFQALPEKAFERVAVRRSFIDAAAGGPLRGTALLMRKLRSLAESSLLPADELYADAVSLARLGGILARLGDKALAAKALERALALDPKDPAIRLELGSAMQTAEHYEDALRLYESLILEGDDRYRRLEVLCALKRFDEAREESEAILRGQPDARRAKRWLADILSWKGDFGESIRHLTELAREAPDDPEIPIRIAEVTFWSGNVDKALSLFQALTEKSLEQARVRRNLIDAAAGSNPIGPSKIDPARMLAAMALALAPQDELGADPIHLARLGLCLHRAGCKAESNRVLDRALASSTREPLARFEIGGALLSAGRHADAYRMFEGLPLEGVQRFRMIDLFTARGDWNSAIRDARTLLTRDAGDLEAKRRMADLLSWKKDYAESIRLFEELAEAKPDDAEIRLRLAELLLWSKEAGKAMLAFQSLPESMRDKLAVRQSFVDAAAGVDAALVEKIDRVAVRRAAEQTLVEGDPLLGDPIFLCRLGFVLHRVGEDDLSIRILERTDKLPLPDEAGRLELAGTLVAVKQFAKAGALYEGMKLQGANRFRRLEMLAAQENWPAAMNECRRLVALDPADRRAQRWQADIASWKGDYAEAARLFQDLTKREPDNLELRIRLAEVHLWAKDHAKTLAVLIDMPEAVLLRPDMRRGFIDAASVGEKLLDGPALARAQRIAVLTLDAPPTDSVRASVPYLSRLAWVLIKGSDRETANKLLTIAVALKPKEPAERKELGGVLAASDRVAEAFQMYEGLMLDGEDRFRLIGLHSAAKDFIHAEEACRKILRDEADNRQATRWLADVLSWKGSYEESLRLFQELILLQPDNQELRVRLAEVTLWSKDGPSALALFEPLLVKDFDRPRIWEGFIASAATVPSLTKEQKQLVVRIQAAAEKADLRSAVFWSRLAWVVNREGDEARAKVYLEKAIALKPTEAFERRELAGVLSALKRYKEATSLYTDFKLEAEDRVRLAEIHAAAEDFPAAIRQLEACLTEFPNDAKASRYLADVLSWNKQYDSSLERFARLLKDAPKDVELRTRQAEVQLWSKANDQALASFRKLLVDGAGDPRLWSGFVDAAAGVKSLDAELGKTAARIAQELGTNAKAKALAADPLFVGRLALVLHRSGQTPLSNALVERIGKNYPTAADARRELAGIFMALGVNRQARELYSGLELGSEDQLRLIDITTADKQFVEAEKMAQAFYQANPKDPKAVRKLASVLASVKKHKEAVGLLQGLQKTNPDDPELAGDLALALLWSGEYDEALPRLEGLLQKGLDARLVEGYLDAAALAKTFDTAARKKTAMAVFDQAKQLKLTNAKLRQMAWIMRRLGEKEKAVALLSTLIAADAASYDIRLELAQTLDDLGKPEEAAKHYRILLNATPPARQ